ncbi:MAG: hypothetical protein ACOYNI_12985 [Acidimicrobiia bacterium]
MRRLRRGTRERADWPDDRSRL